VRADPRRHGRLLNSCSFRQRTREERGQRRGRTEVSVRTRVPLAVVSLSLSLSLSLPPSLVDARTRAKPPARPAPPPPTPRQPSWYRRRNPPPTRRALAALVTSLSLSLSLALSFELSRSHLASSRGAKGRRCQCARGRERRDDGRQSRGRVEGRPVSHQPLPPPRFPLALACSKALYISISISLARSSLYLYPPPPPPAHLPSLARSPLCLALEYTPPLSLTLLPNGRILFPPSLALSLPPLPTTLATKFVPIESTGTDIGAPSLLFTKVSAGVSRSSGLKEKTRQTEGERERERERERGSEQNRRTEAEREYDRTIKKEHCLVFYLK
jgi:hypothetical protein